MSKPKSKKGTSKASTLAAQADMPDAQRAKSGILELDSPTVPGGLPLLPDETAYTIPLSQQLQPLVVRIERPWTDPFHNQSVTTRIDLKWGAETVVPHHEIVGPYDPNTLFPYFCFIPAHYMTNPGFRVIRYEVSNPLIGSDESSPTFVNIDQTAPNQGNAGLRLRFEDEVEADGLSDEYLTDHGGAPVVVPRWSDLHIEDTVIFYWSKTPRLSSSDDDEDEAHTLQITYAHWVDENAPIEATIPEAVIRASGPGRRYAGYRLKDRAGNGGGFSAPTPIEVLTVAAPGDLEKPWIEEALDGLIDLADARLPLKMKIPFIDGASAGDWVMPYWNAQALPSFQLADVNTWPIPRDLSWTVVSSGGFDAPVPTRIHYLYQRGTQQPKPSDSSFFLVDLTVAGPAPEGPDPINRFLDPVTVKGVTGDNIVTSADSNRHLKVEVTLFDNPKPGERLELMWGSDAELARTYTVQQGDVAGQLLELFVPWPVVEGVGSHPRLPVYYWTDNGVNRQRSRDTLVKVAITRIEDLLAPVVVDADARNTINCETVPRPWEGIRVHVPADPRFAPGDTVTLYWKGYSTTNGAGAPIPGSEESFPRILSPEEARDGVDITVLPFNPLITLPGLVTPRNGSAVLQYSLSKQDGSYGDSKKKMIAVSLIRPSGERCLGV